MFAEPKTADGQSGEIGRAMEQLNSAVERLNTITRSLVQAVGMEDNDPPAMQADQSPAPRTKFAMGVQGLSGDINRHCRSLEALHGLF